MKRPISTTLAAAILLGAGAAQAEGPKNARITPTFGAEIPNIPGKSLKAVTVEYGPGASSPSHTHARSAFIWAYVLEGAFRSKVNDGPERTYLAGEYWTEAPGAHHGVSANASDTESAKLLAVFVVDTDDAVLTVPDKK